MKMSEWPSPNLPDITDTFVNKITMNLTIISLYCMLWLIKRIAVNYINKLACIEKIKWD